VGAGRQRIAVEEDLVPRFDETELDRFGGHLLLARVGQEDLHRVWGRLHPGPVSRRGF
jgi:hypothetical protein